MFRYRGLTINPLFVESISIAKTNCVDDTPCDVTVKVIMNSSHVHNIHCKSLKEAKTVRTKIENEVLEVMRFMRFKTLL